MNMRLSEYCGKNARSLEIGNLTLYFSYETLIAFDHPETGLTIRENDWGPTTGKHLNAINDNQRERIPGDVFENRWQEVATALGMDADIQIGA
jgi:hypothetical protein